MCGAEYDPTEVPYVAEDCPNQECSDCHSDCPFCRVRVAA